MIKPKDLSGQLFNRWKVIKSVSKYNGRFLCKCKCGNESIVPGRSLKNGKSKGCKKCRDYPSPSTYNNLIGKTFGLWTVIKHEGIKNKKRSWLCRCSCGKESVVAAGNLIAGKSNGCRRCCKLTKKFKMSIQKRWNTYQKTKSVKRGDKFDRLTVIRDTKERYFRQKLWMCQCKCGKKILTTSWKLLSGKKRSCGCLIDEARIKLGKSRIGPKNPRWRADLSDEDRRNLCYKFRHLFNNPKLVEWRTAVFNRDSFICQVCGKNGGVNAHHLFSWNTHKNLRYDVDNGITMCKKCHRNFHKIHGWGNNTPSQYKIFKNSRIANLTQTL